MDVQDFIVNRDQHMRPLEYDLSENFNELVRYLNDMGVLDNVPVGVTSESEIVSVSDAYPAPPRALTVFGKSTQAGTPTPDAPVPILSVDDLSLVLAGKNWLNIHAERKTNTSVAKDGSGVWYPYAVSNYLNNFSGNSLSIDGDTVTFASKSSYGFGVESHVLPDTTYTISAQSITVSNGAAYEVRMNYFRKDGTFSYRTLGTNVNIVTTTIPSNVIYAIFVVCVSANEVSTITVKGLQLELGSTATAYEPYVGTTIPDLLPEGTSLRSLPDGTKDQLNLSYLRPSTREGWAWYSRELVQVVGAIFGSDLVQFKSNNGFIAYKANTLPIANNSQPLCTWTTTSTSFNSDNMTQECVQFPRTWSPTVYVAALETHNIDDFKILYPTTPVTTTLDPIELPTLPAPTATVWCDGGSAQPTMVLEYVRDTNAAIAELSEAIADIVSG